MKPSVKSRIYRSLKEIVNPEHTALVVFHVHKNMVSGTFNKEEFLQNLKLFIEAARSVNIPIIYAKFTPLSLDYDAPFHIYMLMKRIGVDDPEKIPLYVKAGSPEAEFASEISPKDDDIIIETHALSMFVGTHFEDMMRNKGINTLLFAGASTEIGIASTVRGSIDSGFYTIVVEDCVSTYVREMHEAELKTLRRVCLVIPSKDIVREWK